MRRVSAILCNVRPDGPDQTQLGPYLLRALSTGPGCSLATLTARQARKEFKMRRNSHYSNEGEVMKRFRAGASAPTAAEERDESAIDVDEDQDDDDDDDDDVVGEEARRNARANSATNGRSGAFNQRADGQAGGVPPVPTLPNGMHR